MPTIPTYNRICILGPPGIGKSPLARLFKAGHWEPKRARIPRSEREAGVCMKPELYAARLQAHAAAVPCYASPTLAVFDDMSFFETRGERLILEHTPEAKDPRRVLTMEIGSPILVEMIEKRSHIQGSPFVLDPERLLVVLLNPAAESFRSMREPSMALGLASVFAVTELARAWSATVDLAAGLRRVESLGEELVAWKRLMEIAPNAIECRAWSFFEYAFLAREADRPGLRSMMLAAKAALLQAAEEGRASMETLTALLRTDEEIRATSEVG